MICNNCGKELSENAKFCWSCGASIEPAAAAPIADEVPVSQVPDAEIPVMQECPDESVTESPVYEQPVWSAPVEPTVEPKKPRKKWIPFAIVGGAVAAVAAIVLGLFLSGFFSSDSAKVQKAMTRSIDAFQEVGQTMGMPSFQYVLDEHAYSMDVGFVLHKVQGSEELSGIGMTGSIDYNMPDKTLDLILTPRYGAVDLLDIQMKVDDTMLYLGAPQITGSRFYSFNTETMFADLSRLGADVEGLEGIRIDVFELLQIIGEEFTLSKADQEKITKAADALIDSIEAEMIGSEEITVNGHDIKCDKYEAIIKKDAILAYCEAMMESTAGNGSADILLRLCESLNVPKELLAGADLSTPVSVGDEFMKAMEEALTDCDDFRLTLYLKDGYVMSAVYELDMEGSQAKLELQIGGGENYLDDLSLGITADGQTILLESTGNHSGKNGKFTDETKLYIKGPGFSMRVLNSSLSYDSRQSGENIQWTIGVPTITINISGGMTCDSDSMTLDLSDISFTQSGEELLAFSIYCAMDKYAPSIEIGDSLELLSLSEEAFMEELAALDEKFEQWTMGMADRIPQLMGILV